MLLFRYPDASQTIERAVRWESPPSHEPVSNGPGQRYAASKINQNIWKTTEFITRC